MRPNNLESEYHYLRTRMRGNYSLVENCQVLSNLSDISAIENLDWDIFRASLIFVLSNMNHLASMNHLVEKHESPGWKYLAFTNPLIWAHCDCLALHAIIWLDCQYCNQIARFCWVPVGNHGARNYIRIINEKAMVERARDNIKGFELCLQHPQILKSMHIGLLSCLLKWKEVRLLYWNRLEKVVPLLLAV